MDAQPDDAPLFRLFWENSKLSPRTAWDFARRLDEDGRTAPTVAGLFYPDEHPLPRPTDPLAAAMSRRASARAFSPAPLTARQLGSLFFAAAARPEGGRLFPSAGGKYPLELFALLFNVEGPLGGKIVHYSGDRHALSTVGPAPAWSALAPFVSLTLEGAPAALFVFAAFPSRVTAKYGERGGRFLLLECGHAAQNLALRATHEKLAGVSAGGLYDEELKRRLRLDQTDAVIAYGYACGTAPEG